MPTGARRAGRHVAAAHRMTARMGYNSPCPRAGNAAGLVGRLVMEMERRW
jgi:hypothetical protein